MWSLTLVEAWISTGLIAEMRDEAERVFPLETGGILMGYWATSRAAVITALVAAGPCARHAKSSFEPDYGYQERQIAEIYSDSEGVLTYLGDWHSHPEGMATLSQKDCRLLAAMARHEEGRTPQPLMGVLAGRSAWDLGIWCRRKLGLFGAIRQCELREYADLKDSSSAGG